MADKGQGSPQVVFLSKLRYWSLGEMGLPNVSSRARSALVRTTWRMWGEFQDSPQFYRHLLKRGGRNRIVAVLTLLLMLPGTVPARHALVSTPRERQHAGNVNPKLFRTEKIKAHLAS